MYDLEQLNLHFGERIRSLRQNQNLSQMDLAELADLNTTYIGHLEHGTKSPTLQTLAKLANAFHLTLPDLLALETQAAAKEKKDEIRNLLSEYTSRILELIEQQD